MKRTLALLLALLLLLSAGCGNNNHQQQDSAKEPDPNTTQGDTPSTTEPTDPQRDTMVLGLSKLIDDFNPMNTISGEQKLLFRAVFSTLIQMKINDEGKVELTANLAESWENSNDGKDWIFHLNPNATFSNGDPVTAADVKFTFDELKNSSYLMSTVDMISSVETVDEHTVVIHMGEFSARAPYCWTDLYIVNSRLYQEDLDGYLKTLTGSGPYTLKSLDVATGNIVLERNENYWGDAPQLREISMRVITDKSTLLIALEAGEVDLIHNLAATLIDQAEKNKDLGITQHPTTYTQQLLLNNSLAPFDNKLLRQAIAYAVDWSAVATVSTKNHYNQLTTLMYAPALDVNPDGVKQYTYDPEKAKELLAEAGIETPFDLGLLYATSANGVSELIQQYLNAVGLIVQPQQLEQYAFIYALMDGDYGMAYLGSNGGYLTAIEQLEQFYRTGSAMNLQNYSNPEVDKLIDQIGTEQDSTNRDALILQAFSLIAEDAPVVNTTWDSYYSAHHKDLFVPLGLDANVKLADCHW